MKVTQTQEFKFKSDARAKDRNLNGPTSESFKSTAELIKQFQSKTPARFHTKSRSDGPLVQPVTKLQLTEPVNVVFCTSSRRRPTVEMSSEERELEYIRNLEPFKAKPVNEKVLHSAGDLGVPRIRKRPLTEAVSPKLLTDQRLGLKVVEAPVVKENSTKVNSAPLTITKAQSPKLMTKERAKLKPEPVPEPEEPLPPPFVALPVPDFSKKPISEVPLPKPNLTSPVPFKLQTEERGQVARDTFAKQLEKELKAAQAARQFKAQPIMSFPMDMGTTAVAHKKLCSPHPFKLASEERAKISRSVVLTSTCTQFY
jgi:hypothetical protein